MKLRDAIKLIEEDGWIMVAVKGSHRLQKKKREEMYRYLIVIEKANKNYCAYCPDLPGCVATGKTREETAQNIHTAVEMHIQGLLEDNLPVPKNVTMAEYIAVFE